MKCDKVISFGGFYDIGEKIIVSNTAFNGLLKLDKKSGTGEYLQVFPEDIQIKQGMHHRVYHNNGLLFFAPDNANGVHIYNIETNELKFIPIIFNKSNRKRCIDSQRIGNVLWLFYGYADNPIVKFDMVTYEISLFWGVHNELPDEIKDENRLIFNTTLARNNSEVFSIIWDSFYVIRLDLISEKVQVISLKGYVKRLSGVAYLKGMLYFTELSSKNVVGLDLREKKTFVYQCKTDLKLDETKAFVCFYSNIIVSGEKIILIPNSGRNILYVNIEKGCISDFVILPEQCQDISDERHKWRRFYNFDATDERILLYPNGVNMMIDIDTKNKTITGILFYMEKSWMEKEYHKIIVENYLEGIVSHGPIQENQRITIEDFAKYVENTNITSIKLKENNVGKSIWEKLKNE